LAEHPTNQDVLTHRFRRGPPPSPFFT
jgi:hypothetical protein